LALRKRAESGKSEIRELHFLHEYESVPFAAAGPSVDPMALPREYNRLDRRAAFNERPAEFLRLCNGNTRVVLSMHDHG
jgi:hypothetical protein